MATTKTLDAKWLVIVVLVVIIGILIWRQPIEHHYHEHLHPDGAPSALNEVQTDGSEEQLTDNSELNNKQLQHKPAKVLPEQPRAVRQPMSIQAAMVEE